MGVDNYRRANLHGRQLRHHSVRDPRAVADHRNAALHALRLVSGTHSHVGGRRHLHVLLWKGWKGEAGSAQASLSGQICPCRHLSFVHRRHRLGRHHVAPLGASHRVPTHLGRTVSGVRNDRSAHVYIDVVLRHCSVVGHGDALKRRD